MIALVLVLGLVGSAVAGSPELKANGAVMLDGRHTPVYWDDGDTFKVVETGQSRFVAWRNQAERSSVT